MTVGNFLFHQTCGTIVSTEMKHTRFHLAIQNLALQIPHMLVQPIQLKQLAARSYRQFLVLALAQYAQQIEHAHQRLRELEGK